MKRPDLLILVAIWEFLCAFGALIGAFFMTAMSFAAIPWMGGGMWGEMWEGAWGGWPMMGSFPIAIMSFGLLLVAAYFALCLLGGIGLLQGREWGRILSIVQAALSLLWFPIGTVIGILILIYLVRQEVREYFTGSQGVLPTT